MLGPVQISNPFSMSWSIFTPKFTAQIVILCAWNPEKVASDYYNLPIVFLNIDH